MGDYLIRLGDMLQNLGYAIIPISFLGYLMLAVVSYKFNNRHYAKLVKSIWYFLNGILAFRGDLRVATIATMILFFESLDSFLDYLEEKKKLKSKNVRSN